MLAVFSSSANGEVSKVVENQRALRVLLSTNGMRPYDESSVADVLSTFHAAVLGQLLSLNASFELEPSLIKKWSWESSSNSYTLVLRSGLKFSNGRKVTSEDLEYSLLRGFFSARRSFYAVYLSNIDGLDKISISNEYKPGLVSGITVVSPDTLRVTLKKPNPSFLYSLTNPYFSLVPREAFTEDNLTWKDQPVGAGPYVIASKFSNGQIELKPKDSTILPMVQIFTQDVAESYDVSIVSLDKPKGTDQVVHSKYPASIWSIFFSNANVLGRDPKFRKAILLGIDVDELAKAEDAPPASELLPKHFWGRTRASRTTNLVEARKLLRSFPPELVGRHWKVPVFSSGPFSSERKKRLDILSAQFNRLGLTVDFYPSSEKFLSYETAQESPMKLSGRVADLVDPLIMFASFRESSPYKYEKPLKDDEFERRYEVAAAADNMDARVKSVSDLSLYTLQNAFVCPLIEDRQKTFFNSAKIASLGSQPQPMTVFLERIQMKSVK